MHTLRDTCVDLMTMTLYSRSKIPMTLWHKRHKGVLEEWYTGVDSPTDRSVKWTGGKTNCSLY